MAKQVKMTKVQILKTVKVALDGIGVKTKLCLVNTQEEIPDHLIAGLAKEGFVEKKLKTQSKKELDAIAAEEKKQAAAEKKALEEKEKLEKEEASAKEKEEAEQKADYSAKAFLALGREEMIKQLEGMSEEVVETATDEELATQLEALFADEDED